jgi:pentatricopeptide repeat protein
MITKLTLYRNELHIRFSQSGENFTLDVPHYKKWLNLIRFLKKRGFKVGENAYYKAQYGCLSQYHKIGFKRDVALLMEINRDSIKLEFGHIKNLWRDMPQSFWSDPSDDRYASLTYLEGIAVKLEIKKAIIYLQKWADEFEHRNKELSPVKALLKRKAESCHSKATSLEEIKDEVENGTNRYNWNNNSWDKHKKRIRCGEVKYFYDYDRRLCCGTVWHNLNNMWFVICGNKLRNVASFDLFDFDASLPRRRAISERSWSNLLDGFAKLRDYKKCMHIQQYMDRNGILIDSPTKSTAA